MCTHYQEKFSDLYKVPMILVKKVAHMVFHVLNPFGKIKRKVFTANPKRRKKAKFLLFESPVNLRKL